MHARRTLFLTTLIAAALLLAAPMGVCATGEAAAASVSARDAARAALDAAIGRDSIDASGADEAERVFREWSEREPNDGRWLLGLALVERARGNGEATLALAERAAARSPRDADAHYMLGSAVFATMSDVSMFRANSVAKRGREAYEEAIRLDPNHVRARFGLVMFHTFAPGLAGGARRTAREHATELLNIEGGRFQGRIGLAQLAGVEKKWDEMRAEYELAEQEATSDEQVVQAVFAHASSLLRRKEEPAEALPVAERLVSLSPDNASAWFLLGEIRRELKRWPEAIIAYTRVLEISPDAQNSRFALAMTFESAGDEASALREYREFVRRFPNHSRVKDAEKKIKALSRRVG